MNRFLAHDLSLVFGRRGVWLAFTLVAILLVPLMGSAAPSSPLTPDISLLGPPKIRTASDGAMAKVDPQVLNQARNASATSTLGVLVVSQGPLATARLMTRVVARRPDPTGLTFTEGQLSPQSLSVLASDPNVIAVLSDAPPLIDPLPEPRYARPVGGRPDKTGTTSRLPQSAAGTGTANPGSPESWHTLDVHHVRDAWAQGYRGEGVNVAVIDSGVDFGHPDLQGTFARVEDPASPYYGWPYVVDPYSMELLSVGLVHDVPGAIRGYGSWYIDTSTVVQGPTARFTTVTATASSMDPITHTYTLPGTSRSGLYHMGIHPDEHLAFDVDHEFPAVLVADTVTPGVYDTVYVDLNNNYDFHDDTPLRKGSELSTLDNNGDGLADLSSGLLYFIGDGRTPIPASDWLFGLLPPGNGDLVALYGSFDYLQDHGTFCASSIVAQGRVDGPNPIRPPYKPAGVGGMVQGMAPQARIVAIGNIYRSGMAIYNALLLATLGLDGRPNTGDEPQIASMSWGLSGGWNNGWDYMSRYLLYLSTYNTHLAWLASTGNGGPGYGTITPPATSPAAISVGAATQYGETTNFEPISSTSRITWGDVQPWSNRGPSHLGQPKPDFVAVGAWGTGDVPINMTGNGSTAYDIWGGTSMSTPVGAGIAALVYQAYRQAHGEWPTAETARVLLKSSATDLNYGPFVQGAGMLDAQRATLLAAGQSGVSVSPSSWVPGTTAPAYVGLLTGGQTVTQSFTLQNTGSAAVQARIYGSEYVQTSEYEWTVPISNGQETRGDFARPDYLWNMTPHIPTGTDLVRVSAVISFTEFSLSNPRSPFLGVASSWRVLAYDWHDENGDGLAAQDLNSNGVVNTGELETGELNRLTYGYNLHDIVSLSVEKPLERSGDGFMVGLQHAAASSGIPTSTVHMKLATYRRQDWPMLQVQGGQVTIPARGSASVEVDAQAPEGTPPGAYEGSVVVETGSGSGASRIIVPVAMNLSAGSLPVTLGGANRPPSGTLFDNGRVTGEQNWGWRPDAGEWRHFYFDNTTPPPQDTFLWADVRWRNFPSDFDLVVGGPTPWDWFSQRNPALFGPHGIDGIGGSQWTNLGGGNWQWKTTTGSTEEWVSGRVGQVGTHEAVVHNVFYSGLEQSESFTATLGTVHLSRDDLEIVSPGSAGTATLTMTTAMDLPGIRAEAYGLAQKQTWRDIGIEPLHTWFTDTTLSNLASVEFSTEAPEGTNVDLFVDHWENGRYVWLASSTSPTGNEYVRIEPAEQGNYRVRIDAAPDVPSNAHFDFSIKAIAGTDLSVDPEVITGTVAAGTTLTFTVGYDRPGIPDGVWEGRLFLGPYDAPALLSLPVTVYKGEITPTPTPTPLPCHSLFTDVPSNYWAHTYIESLYCRNIISGYNDRTFRPNYGASRVQLTKMLVLGMGWPLQHPATPTFSDVPEFSWGYEFVETAAARGIINGYADGTFHPSNPVTRGQLARMLVGAKGWELLDPPTPAFNDVPRSSPFYRHIETAANHGLVSGYGDGTFHPGAGATRAQLSKMLYNALAAP